MISKVNFENSNFSSLDYNLREDYTTKGLKLLRCCHFYYYCKKVQTANRLIPTELCSILHGLH